MIPQQEDREAQLEVGTRFALMGSSIPHTDPALLALGNALTFPVPHVV